MTQQNTDLNGDPLWYKDAIIYELHVKSFFDSSGDGIGDFRGLIEKLDYLDSLGITAIWLLPFYPSPLRDDGYDIADYYNIHPDYGTLRDFRRFLRQAHKRNIRVITELVINHTSDQHGWFQRARRAKAGSVWRNYYVWSDSPEKYQETRIIFQDFESSNWTWDAVAKAYFWHRFYSHQPDLNYDNPRVQKEMLRIIDFWFAMGVDGLRLDAVPYLYDGLYNREFRGHILCLITRRRKLKGQHGELVTRQGKKLRELRTALSPDIQSRVLKVEQSNSSIVYEDLLFLKMYRRLEEGINPDVEVIHYLTENTEFTNVAPFTGSLEYRQNGNQAYQLILLQGLIQNEGDVWTIAVDAVGRYFERVLSEKIEIDDLKLKTTSLFETDWDDIPEQLRDLIDAIFLEQMTLLGQRTGEMHLNLASGDRNRSFKPEPFSKLYQRALYQSLRSNALRGLQTLEKNMDKLPEELKAQALEILPHKQQLQTRLRRVLNKKISAAKIRIHGDYHLGQVLHTGKDFIIIDFEGELARSPGERRLKYSSFRHVAGMIRSFHYAVYSSLFQQTAIQPEYMDILNPWAELWYQCVSGVFLNSYLKTVSRAPFVPKDREELEILLQAFILDKAIYELGYELNNRPDWVIIPIKGIKLALNESD